MTRRRAEPASPREALLVLLFALLAGASGLFVVPPLDRDESRFVQATVQMMETGDYVRIRYQETERNKKPVGIHWLQAASVTALSDVEARAVWAYRLPSLLGAAAAALGTYLLGCALFGRRAGLVAAILLASAPVVLAEATIAKTDAALLGSIVLAQWALVGIWSADREAAWRPLAFWAALGAGVLIKGPIAPMVVGLTMAGLVATRWQDRAWILRLRPLIGLGLLAVIVLPWFVAIGLVTEGRFYAEAVGTDMLGKVGEAQESHAGPPGYHAALLWAMFWPAALALPAASRWAVPRWRSESVLFCLAWIVPSWIVFELAGTKLPHYPMVLYPALALLIGGFVVSDQARFLRGWRWGGLVAYLLVGLLAAGGALYLLADGSSAGIDLSSALLLAGIVLCIGTTAWQARHQLGPRAVLLASATSAALGWVLFQHVVPRLDDLAVTPRLAAVLEGAGVDPRRDGAPPIALLGYHEPSAVFTLGTDTILATPEEATTWLETAPGRVAAIEERRLPEALALLDTVPETIGVVEGRNYSNGRDVRIVVLRSR